MNKGMIPMWVKTDDSDFHTLYRRLIKFLQKSNLILVDFEETLQTCVFTTDKNYPTERKLYKARWEREV